jgi:DNA-binding NarL/FixJ family response regulator
MQRQGRKGEDMPAKDRTTINVLIVDDLEHVREGLRTVLELIDDLDCVGQAADGRQAVQQVEELAPDVVLMDLEMPEMDGLEATRQIKRAHPETGVVMLTIHEDAGHRERAARAGVDAFVAKGAALKELRAAIRRVRQDCSKTLNDTLSGPVTGHQSPEEET